MNKKSLLLKHLLKQDVNERSFIKNEYPINSLITIAIRIIRKLKGTGRKYKNRMAFLKRFVAEKKIVKRNDDVSPSIGGTIYINLNN